MSIITQLDGQAKIFIIIITMVSEVEEIENLRKELGLAQREVANMLDVGMSTYQAWVYEGTRPSYDSLQKINDFIEEKKSNENVK